ncbi:MAG TPA: hypothetical protein DDX84_04705 [Nitrospiraceae bacterium]|nr:hypothetical protein [Nitrospiraceae bacterium]
MSIAYSIIKDHGGTIDVESIAGMGTKFIIEFPVDRRKVPRSKEAMSNSPINSRIQKNRGGIYEPRNNPDS